MSNAGLDESQTRIKIARRNISSFRYADDTIPMAESEEELKNLLMRVKEESENAGSKLNVQKKEDHIIQSHLHGKQKGKNVRGSDFIFLGYKITADSDCSHEIKIYLLLGRKAMTNLDSLLKSRDITLPTKVCIVKELLLLNCSVGEES